MKEPKTEQPRESARKDSKPQNNPKPTNGKSATNSKPQDNPKPTNGESTINRGEGGEGRK